VIHGYVEGLTWSELNCWAEWAPDRYQLWAADLVGRKVDVIIAMGRPHLGGGGEKNATQLIPMSFRLQPVKPGLVASRSTPSILARRRAEVIESSA